MPLAHTSPLPPPGWAGVGTCALDVLGRPIPWRPSYHVLMLATGGHGMVEVDFVRHTCRPGTLLWVRPGQELRAGEDGLAASVITFESRLAEVVAYESVDLMPPPLHQIPDQYLPGTPEDRDLKEFESTSRARWQLEGEDEDAVISEFAQLAVDCERHEAGALAAELLRHELTVLLLRIALLSRSEPVGAESRTFARFIRLLETGHPNSRRVEDYADELTCSVRTLTRACLAVTGRTAKQVVDDRVALEARRLLACTSMSVAEVGRSLGFPEPTNFGRFFHREVGTSPGQFRMDTTPDGSGRIPVQRRPPD
ncbi:AraC family transcriptional regulator [Actinoplanes sp. TBRC 11911]|uniref:AraC family transcriptional regulator n=1 Tax=Actinoplanes sp. TBRC 11911 TaxID=2729386 RepID=UPI00145E3A1A|nr:AraC family transcriptional regulator [Actinoplanes sp. TBRC 11911]NMO51139.1 AraC family transcriptional regulator [Actinoplanes sp. TBRC 11911]